MGVLTEFLNMDTKPVYCHGSSGKLMNQYMVKDHMLSHYKKLYSAKAAVDCSVPKSMECNVKYVDQKRRELKKDAPSRSGRSESQRSSRFNSRASSSSKISGASDKGDHYLDHSVMSSPRISTSFHSKQIVYPSRSIRASATHFRCSSELQGYGSPNLQSGHSSSFKTFQDPKQKTYSGDVLLKHAHHFTQEKPFTPRTLKSSHRSTLAQYRYYTAPKRKDEEKRTSSFQMTRLESSQSKRGFSPHLVSPQTFSVVHEWSDEESDSFRRHRTADFLLSSSRVSPEGMKSPVMRRVTAEEEELMYLEFIADVTNEILAQGLYSDRVLKRVFERHIDMNRHRLDENKMRHLLDNLHHDLQKPSGVSVSFPSVRDSGDPIKLLEKSLKLAHGLPSETTDDADVLIPNEVRGQRENITSTPIEKQPLNLEFACLGDTADDNELLERVEEVEKSMRKLLNVSETEKSETEEEQMTNKLSDDDF